MHKLRPPFAPFVPLLAFAATAQGATPYRRRHVCIAGDHIGGINATTRVPMEPASYADGTADSRPCARGRFAGDRRVLAVLRAICSMHHRRPVRQGTFA